MKTLTKEEMAEELAQTQRRWDDSVVSIYRVRGDDEMSQDEPLKLLVVSEETIPVGVMPLYFPSDFSRGFVSPFVFVVVTPDEFKGLEAGVLSLPADWQIAELVESENVQRTKTAA